MDDFLRHDTGSWRRFASGHLAEAQTLQALGVDFIDESEVLTHADDKYHVNKHKYEVPFVCGARDLGEALRRIAEGAAMIRSKGEAGSGNIVEAVRHIRAITDEIAILAAVPEEELTARARDLSAPLELVRYVAREKKLPVVLFCAGGVATPADAALMMQLGAEGILRRQRNLQVQTTGQVRQSDRRCDDALQRSERARRRGPRTGRCGRHAGDRSARFGGERAPRDPR